MTTNVRVYLLNRTTNRCKNTPKNLESVFAQKSSSRLYCLLIIYRVPLVSSLLNTCTLRMFDIYQQDTTSNRGPDIVDSLASMKCTIVTGEKNRSKRFKIQENHGKEQQQVRA
jgi:hypothetical protein